MTRPVFAAPAFLRSGKGQTSPVAKSAPLAGAPQDAARQRLADGVQFFSWMQVRVRAKESVQLEQPLAREFVE